MRIKPVLGWLAIILISIIPVFLWFILGPGTADLVDYSTITHSLGELFGLVGMTMFAFTFVLSTRIEFIEDIFGGLDKVYIAHGILGGTALMLILFHPIFLVLKFLPSNITLAVIYLLPSSYWQVNFGIIALFGLIALVFITLYTKMNYSRWKFTHEFLGLIFLFAVLHIFLVRGTVSNDNIFDGYYIYAFVVSALGIAAFLYSLLIKGRMLKNVVYVVSKINSGGDYFEITMVPEHKPIRYKSGQFIFVRFYNERLSKEAHPFSIASHSGSLAIKIVIKKLGDYTHRMEHLKVGDKVAIEGPYGTFNYADEGRDQVWVAGGIGITPFLGMVEDLHADKEMKSTIYLYYSVKDKSEFIGYDLLESIASRNPKFRFIPWDSKNRGHITTAFIQSQVGMLRTKDYFLCGSTRFKEDIITSLINSGVSRERIHEEAFDFR